MATKQINTPIGIANINTTKWWDYDGNDKETYSLFHQGQFLGEMALTEDQIYGLVNDLNKYDIVIDLS